MCAHVCVCVCELVCVQCVFVFTCDCRMGETLTCSDKILRWNYLGLQGVCVRCMVVSVMECGGGEMYDCLLV